MPGVLIDGGPRGLDEERACRLRPDVASLRDSSGALSERITASTRDDMLVMMDYLVCAQCVGCRSVTTCEFKWH